LLAADAGLLEHITPDGQQFFVGKGRGNRLGKEKKQQGESYHCESDHEEKEIGDKKLSAQSWVSSHDGVNLRELFQQNTIAIL